jgi:tRNA threonylcarbamoyladenosine biosynthesis protein TsaB
MRILAVDTATKSCSVAVTEKGSLTAELTTVTAQTHSKHLLNMIRSVIKAAGIAISDLDGFAVTVGPGSFTGLRIGISSVKGFAVALDKPAVGVSSLDALAQQAAPSSYLVCSLLDARKDEVYFCTYRINQERLIKEKEEMVVSPDEALKDINQPCIFVGSGAQLYREVIKARLGKMAYFAPQSQNIIRASTVAYLSLKKFENDDTNEVGGLTPHYIRKSDAELNFGKPRKNRKQL